MQVNRIHNSGVYYVDSTAMPIYSNAHRYRVKIDLGLASSGRNIHVDFNIKQINRAKNPEAK